MDGSEGVWFYSDAAGQWRMLANTALLFDSSLPTLAMGAYENVVEYNPLRRVLLFGGGSGSGRIFYKMDASGRITRMRDAPETLFSGTVYGLVSADPASGKYLAFRTDGRYYEYEVDTDTWTLLPGTHPLGSAGYFELCEAPISTHGVLMYVDHNSRTVWLYKHAAGALSPNPDTDGDGLPDAWETQRFGNLAQTGAGDPDADGLANAQEFARGTNPTVADTDSDGFPDGQEVASGSDPLDPASVPGGGGGGGGGSGGGGCGATGLEILLVLGVASWQRRRPT